MTICVDIKFPCKHIDTKHSERYYITQYKHQVTISKNESIGLRKAATLVTQHKQEAAMAETDQLSSMPLSQIAIDDSGPPVVHYGSCACSS